MADNVRWIADVAEPGSRMVVWAHNFHFNVFADTVTWMGRYLEPDGGDQFFCGGERSGKVRTLRRPKRGSRDR